MILFPYLFHSLPIFVHAPLCYIYIHGISICADNFPFCIVCCSLNSQVHLVIIILSSLPFFPIFFFPFFFFSPVDRDRTFSIYLFFFHLFVAYVISSHSISAFRWMGVMMDMVAFVRSHIAFCSLPGGVWYLFVLHSPFDYFRLFDTCCCEYHPCDGDCTILFRRILDVDLSRVFCICQIHYLYLNLPVLCHFISLCPFVLTLACRYAVRGVGDYRTVGIIPGGAAGDPRPDVLFACLNNFCHSWATTRLLYFYHTATTLSLLASHHLFVR